VLLLLTVLMVALVSGVAAAAPPRVGAKISLLGCGFDPREEPCVLAFPASEPFHIAHGWIADPGQPLKPSEIDFHLFVDGVAVHGPTEISWTRDQATGERLLTEIHIFNFKKGLPAGEYQFFAIFTQPDFTSPGDTITHTISATLVVE
jgi:hypothetical protein